MIADYKSDSDYSSVAQEIEQNYILDLKGPSTNGKTSDLKCLALGNKNTVYPCDLFLLRPNIEHNMLGIIFGRGGEHVLQAFDRICNDAGFATRRKQVLTSGV